MRERLIELLDQNCGYVEEQKAEKLADYLLENGVIQIPVKVGDVVYQTDSIRIYELLILDIVLFRSGPYYRTDSIDFDDNAIGKSVFLTKDEAEKALKGGASDGEV